MGEYREIITKAVVAKGRKFTQSNHTNNTDQHPIHTLAPWGKKQKYKAKSKNYASIFKNFEDGILFISSFGS